MRPQSFTRTFARRFRSGSLSRPPPCWAATPDEQDWVDPNARPSLDINRESITFEAYSTDPLQTRTLSLQNHGTDTLVLTDLTIVASTGAFTIVEGVDASGRVEVTPRTQQWITIAWDPAPATAPTPSNEHQRPAQARVQVDLSALVQPRSPSRTTQ